MKKSFHQKVLVTGGAGFIGSHLVKRLLELNYHVKVVDNFSTGKIENLNVVLHHPNLQIIQGNICNAETVLKASEGVNFILHQAALVSVPASIKEPQASFQNNTVGTFNVFEAARIHRVERVVFASSAAVYKDTNNIPLHEKMLLSPVSPYALDKLYAEQLAKLYADIYAVPSIGLRYFNVYGERQNPKSSYSGVISIFIDNLKSRKPITIFGDGQQTRDFVYVKNVVDANILALLSQQESFNMYNVASGKSTSILQLIAILQKVSNISFINQLYSNLRQGEIYHSQADISLIKQELGWTPRWSLEQGLSQAFL